MRLAIAMGKGRVPARPGRVGENSDRSDSTLHPSQVARKALSTS
jgi:hypothetical protein